MCGREVGWGFRCGMRAQGFSTAGLLPRRSRRIGALPRPSCLAAAISMRYVLIHYESREAVRRQSHLTTKPAGPFATAGQLFSQRDLSTV